MPQQQKPNFLEGVENLFKQQQPAKGSQQQKGSSESGLKQAQKLISVQKTFQQRLRQRGSSIDDVTPPKFKMGEPVYFVENKHRYNGVITQVPSGKTQVLNAAHNVFVPWKTMMEQNPFFQDIPGSGSVWNMDGERLYLIKLDDNKTISSAYESDLFSDVRQQSQHTKQSFLQKNKQLKTEAHKAIYGKIGLDVIVKFNDHVYSGEIIAIPPDGTVIYDISDEHFGNNTSIIKWKKNNRSDENLIESFEDQPGTGSVWYFPKNKKPVRKYFVKLLNQNVVLVSESKISLTKRTTRFL